MGASMHEHIFYVRSQYPWAEAEIRGGTGESPALGAGPAVAVAERWVIFSEDQPEAPVLGEGDSIEAAWADAARKIRSTLKLGQYLALPRSSYVGGEPYGPPSTSCVRPKLRRQPDE
jgi:hypothetical protein